MSKARANFIGVKRNSIVPVSNSLGRYAGSKGERGDMYLCVGLVVSISPSESEKFARKVDGIKALTWNFSNENAIF